MLSFDDNLLVVDSNPACVTKHPVISAQTNCDCAPLVQVHNTQVLFTFTWKVIWQAPVTVCKNELFPVWLYVTVFYKKTILPNMVLSVLSPSCLATVALEAGLMALPALGTNMARKGIHVIYVHVLVPHFANFTMPSWSTCVCTPPPHREYIEVFTCDVLLMCEYSAHVHVDLCMCTRGVH